jgi:aryl-alcohol dehydrogenase-like predicted oxidoreductase
MHELEFGDLMGARTILDVNSLSKIGVGAYRISIHSTEHQKALIYALRSGCNIIDTSANYMNGKSEMIIGQVMADYPEFDAFVITKGGYIQGDNLAVIERLNQRGLAHDGLATLADDYKYSIHPDFLRSQIKLSCSRLARQQLDGFLLHNPEHYLKNENNATSQNEFYGRIRKAFEFLEESVLAGTIRYYGVSSNTFPFSTEASTTTDLHKILAVAESVSGTHHFTLIQFPFNLFEQEALQQHHGGVSLVELARAKGLITFCNRPLNANTTNGAFRIATYNEEIREIDEAEEHQTFSKCVELIYRQLRRLGLSHDPMDFTVMQFLRDSRMEIVNPELVTQIFQDRLYPLLDRLYEGAIPGEEKATYIELQRHATLYSRRVITERALALRRQMIEQGIIGKDDPRPMATIACEKYLSCGIDHVLVGMKNIKYVESLKLLF